MKSTRSLLSVRSELRGLSLVCLLVFLVATPASAAQRADSSVTGVQRQTTPRQDTLARRDTANGPPISPARAFVSSALVPGLGQSILGRRTGVAIFATVEVTAWAMLLRSMSDLSRAKRFARDSIVSDYRINATTGLVERDPDTGQPIVENYEIDVFREGLISVRQQHVEDWAALIIFNHLMSGVDALVAAHLWDAGAQIRIEPRERGAAIVGRIRW